MSVSKSLTSVNLSNNNLTSSKYVKQNKLTGASFSAGTSVTFEGQQLTILKERDSDGDMLLGVLTGVKALADAISVSKSLTSIDLSWNHGGPEFGIEIAKGLAVSNKSLTSVNLYSNDLGAEGGKAIAEAITISKSLTTIK